MRLYRKRAWIICVMLLAGVVQASEMMPNVRQAMRPDEAMRAKVELAATPFMAKAVVLGAVSIMLVMPAGDKRLPVLLMKQLSGAY